LARAIDHVAKRQPTVGHDLMVMINPASRGAAP
jgi:hypothetical protein